MTIKLLKDHDIYKSGTEIEAHPNEQYLITLGVAVKVEQKKEKVEKNKNGTNK